MGSFNPSKPHCGGKIPGHWLQHSLSKALSFWLLLPGWKRCKSSGAIPLGKHRAVLRSLQLGPGAGVSASPAVPAKPLSPGCLTHLEGILLLCQSNTGAPLRNIFRLQGKKASVSSSQPAQTEGSDPRCWVSTCAHFPPQCPGRDRNYPGLCHEYARGVRRAQAGHERDRKQLLSCIHSIYFLMKQ